MNDTFLNDGMEVSLYLGTNDRVKESKKVGSGVRTAVGLTIQVPTRRHPHSTAALSAGLSVRRRS